jgi:hypothetical protein
MKLSLARTIYKFLSRKKVTFYCIQMLIYYHAIAISKPAFPTIAVFFLGVYISMCNIGPKEKQFPYDRILFSFTLKISAVCKQGNGILEHDDDWVK